MFNGRSALSAQIPGGSRDGADGKRALRLSEVRGWYLAQLGVFRGREDELTATLAPLLNADLPFTAAQPTEGRGRVYRTAPDQYWVVSNDSALISEMSQSVSPAVGTVTPLSHSRVRLAVAGEPVLGLLAKGIALDMHPSVFPIGCVAQTGLHHTGILLEHTDEHRFELYVLRTFAVSIWDWLIDAALPFGYDTSLEQL